MHASRTTPREGEDHPGAGPQPLPAHRAEPECHRFAGASMRVLLTGTQTGGAFCLVEAHMASGFATAPHRHTREDEAFLVLEGRLQVTLGGACFELRPGEVCFAPRGVPHRLHNPGDAPLRLLAVVTPAGFEHYLRAIAAQEVPGKLPGPEDLERLTAIGARFGIVFAAAP